MFEKPSRGADLAPPALLTVKEAAAILKVGEAKLRGLIHKGDLLAYRVGVELRVPNQALQAFVERNVARHTSH